METLIPKRLELFLGATVLSITAITILLTPWPNATQSIHRPGEQSQANLPNLRSESDLCHRVEELTH